MIVTIELPWTKPPLTGNRERNNRHVFAAKVRKAKEQAQEAIRDAETEPMNGPVIVGTHWRIPNRGRRDADNLAATHKVCQDALVLEGVIARDDWAVVPTAQQTIHPPNGEPAAMWLTIEPTEEP